MWSIREVIPIHEDVFPPRVTVKVTNKDELTFTIESAYQLFNCRIDRMKNFGWILPSAVKVLTAECASIVTIYDTICIEHRNYLEYKVISQCLSLGCIADQEIYNAFHHPTCIAFTGMHPCTDEDSLFCFCFLIIWILVL